MKRKVSKTIAAVACAALIATQMAAGAAAVDTTNYNWYYYYNGYYYSDPNDAASVAGSPGIPESVPAIKVPANSAEQYYSPSRKKYYNTKADAESEGATDAKLAYKGAYYANPYYNYGYSYGQYYSYYTGKYYSSYQAALIASGGNSSYVKYVGNGYGTSYGYYYSSVTGQYYSTYEAALAASGGTSAYVTYVDGYYYGNGYGSNYVTYYSSSTNRYYSTYEAALAASGGDSTKVTQVYGYNNGGNTSNYYGYKYYYNGSYYPSVEAAVAAGGTVGVNIYYYPNGTPSDTKYYYYYNGKYYGSLSAAQAAGGTALGVDISYVPYNYYGSTYGYYGYGYGYMDPYYSYRNLLNNRNNTTEVTTKEAEDGEPYIYGKKTKAGWKTVIKYINAATKGTTINVDMNGCYEIDADVMEALDGKNVNVCFVLDNGVQWTINGQDITDPDNIIIYTEYDIDYIPASLLKKASKDSVAKAQVGISNSFDDLGTDASVTVKFSKKRADLTAVIYRYDPDSNSLKGIGKSKVQSNGNCTFTIDAGGPYLIILK